MTATINASTTAGVVTTADTSGILQLQTNGTAALTVDASQNVGIGTASPASKLEVSGSGTLELARFATTTDNTPSIGIYSNGSIRGKLRASSAETALLSQGALPLLLGTNDTERARIDSSGNFFINSTSFPAVGTEKFGVQGTTGIAAAFTTNSASNPTGFFSNISTGTVNLVRFSSGPSGTTVGNITGNGTNAAYNTSSDYRLKNTIAPMTGALNKVALLKPCTYKWNVNGSDGQGFIAHELQTVVPECVTGEKDAVDADGNPQYQGIDTSFLVATLTAAIQELKAIVDAQGAEIAALKGATA